jgi:hypothetical protein
LKLPDEVVFEQCIENWIQGLYGLGCFLGRIAMKTQPDVFFRIFVSDKKPLAYGSVLL